MNLEQFKLLCEMISGLGDGALTVAILYVAHQYLVSIMMFAMFAYVVPKCGKWLFEWIAKNGRNLPD